MWGTEVARAGGAVPFLVYQQRRRRVTELLDDAARWADRDHLVQGRRRVTFAEMTAAADRVAGHLAARGLGLGDRLLLLAANSPDWVISLWAALRLGAVVAPGNRWWSAEEIAHAIELTAPAVIIADTEMTRLLPASTGTGTGIGASIGAGPAVVPVADVRAAQDGPRPALPAVQGGEDDPALIIFTAGTTGLAKAAVLAHRSVIANLQNLLVTSKRLPHQLSRDRPPEVILQSGPLFHIGGIQSLLLALLGGNTMVFLEGRFDAGQVLDLIERERVSIWGAVPTMAIRVLTDPTLPGRDLSAVRSISLGGSPVTPELSDRLRAAFPAVRRGVSTIYGMTEAGGTVAAASGALMAEHPQTAGRPLPVVEMRIEEPDEAGTGEIIVRTPSQMLGYWGEDAPEVIDADGWLHTGDLGRIDEGLLYVTGRAKDVIIRGGENIAASHVE
jgi:long-chain acyl-CoA synthetase